MFIDRQQSFTIMTMQRPNEETVLCRHKHSKCMTQESSWSNIHYGPAGMFMKLS